MGTKKNPGPHDCYAEAEDDEPMFVLLARDPLAPRLVRKWAFMRAAQNMAGDAVKVDEAHDCANAMDAWQQAREPQASP